MVTINEYGKDHWSLMAYIETVCVDGNGKMPQNHVERDRMRCNLDKHPLLAGPRQAMSMVTKWKPEWATRLRDGSQPDPTHDDWDCLEDLEDVGMVYIYSLVNGIVLMTQRGLAIAREIRELKLTGGTFRDFTPSEAALAASSEMIAPAGAFDE